MLRSSFDNDRATCRQLILPPTRRVYIYPYLMQSSNRASRIKDPTNGECVSPNTFFFLYHSTSMAWCTTKSCITIRLARKLSNGFVQGVLNPLKFKWNLKFALFSAMRCFRKRKETATNFQLDQVFIDTVLNPSSYVCTVKFTSIRIYSFARINRFFPLWPTFWRK